MTRAFNGCRQVAAVVCLVALGAADAAAHDAHRDGESRARVAERMATVVAAFDRDGDGGISVHEFTVVRADRFAAADSDGDTRLSLAEYARAANEPATTELRLLFVGADRDGDGHLDRIELDAVSARRFQDLDDNGDGRLDVDELVHHALHH